MCKQIISSLTIYKLQVTTPQSSWIKRKLAVNHPIYQHFTSDELNKFHNCNTAPNPTPWPPPAIPWPPDLPKVPPLPLTWLQPSKSSWPLRRELPPHLARTFGARGSSSSQRQKRDPLAWNCCILPHLLCLLPQWRLNAFFQFVDNFILQLEAAFCWNHWYACFH